MTGSVQDGAKDGAGRVASRRRDWERRGLVGPVEILTRREAARLGAAFRGEYAASGIAATRNRHVDLPVLASLCADAGTWRVANEILGDDLLLWRTNLFLGNPTLPWHEDRHARLFAEETFSLSMLLAIEESPPDNCTVFVPGSHRLAVQEKEARYGITATVQPGGNVRYAGEVPDALRAPCPLRAGEAVLFHPELLHASAGFLSGEADPSGERMSLTFRVAASGATLRDEAFPSERERPEEVLRIISPVSGARG